MTPTKTNEEMIEEFNAKFMANNRISGYGMEVTCHQPCPFCAEPDFMEYKIMDMDASMNKEHICKHCERGMITELVRGPDGAVMSFFQTRGSDLPEWFNPKFPRKVIDDGQTPK